jgi:pimeloyl-ACP methyl ester carboxylesterase
MGRLAAPLRVKSVLRLDALTAFSQCRVPTLYLRGTDDRLVPDTAWRRMGSARPITTSHIQGPHMLLQANPAGAWRAVIEFLETISLRLGASASR